MEKEGYVSLWVGNFSSSEEFHNYFLTSYTEDGGSIPSNFEEDFNIAYFDEDFKEAAYSDHEYKNISILLEDCSYDDIVIPNFVNEIGDNLAYSVNGIILLYNFHYPKVIDNEGGNVKCLGCVKYR